MAIPYRYEKKVIRLGHSYVISLPFIWWRANNITPNDKVVVEVYDDKIVIRKRENGRSKFK